MKAEVFMGSSSFQGLEGAWRGLEGDAGATVFQSWDWGESRLKQFGANPVVIKVTDGLENLALAPLERSNAWYGLPLRRLRFLGTGPSDYGGLLLKPGREEALALVVAAARDLDFDVIDLHQLPGWLAHRLRDMLAPDFAVYLLEQEPTLVVKLPPDFETYLSGLSKKFRSNTLYAERRLQRDLGFEQKNITDVGQVPDAMTVFFNLHQQRWISKKLPGLFLGRRNRRFHTALACRLALTGKLALSLGYVEGRPVGAFYGFKDGRNFSYYLGGFDPAYAKYSVSTVMIFNLLKEAVASSYGAFDFLRGQEPYKLRWLAEPQALYRLVVCSQGPRGRLAGRLARRENELVQRARARLHS